MTSMWIIEFEIFDKMHMVLPISTFFQNERLKLYFSFRIVDLQLLFFDFFLLWYIPNITAENF